MELDVDLGIFVEMGAHLPFSKVANIVRSVAISSSSHFW